MSDSTRRSCGESLWSRSASTASAPPVASAILSALVDHQILALDHLPNGLNERLEGHAFDHVPGGSRVDRRAQQLQVGVGGEHDHLDLWQRFLDLASDVDPRASIKTDVHQDDIGFVLSGLGESIDAGTRLPDEGHVALTVYVRRYAGSHHKVVVHDQYPNCHIEETLTRLDALAALTHSSGRI